MKCVHRRFVIANIYWFAQEKFCVFVGENCALIGAEGFFDCSRNKSMRGENFTAEAVEACAPFVGSRFSAFAFPSLRSALSRLDCKGH